MMMHAAVVMMMMTMMMVVIVNACAKMWVLLVVWWVRVLVDQILDVSGALLTTAYARSATHHFYVYLYLSLYLPTDHTILTYFSRCNPEGLGQQAPNVQKLRLLVASPGLQAYSG